MAGNKTLELSIKIAGRVDKSLLSAINAAQSNVSSLSTTLSRVGTVGLAAMGTLATGTVAALAKCTDAAAEFANGMAPVVKYVEGLADASGNVDTEKYAEASKIIRDLSTQIPLTQSEIQEISASLGQANKSYDELFQRDKSGNISGLVKDAAIVATAWDIEAKTAGDYMAKWETSMSMSHDQVIDLMDQINYLGGHSATTAAEIAAAVNSAASLGQIGGIDPKVTAALADAMLATGVATDRVGTSIKRMVTNFSKGSSATKQQKELWEELGFTAEGVAASMQTDSVGTLNSIFNAIKNLPEERQVSALSTLFGQWAIEGGAKIVGNMKAYQDALNMVNDPSLYKGSMTREFVIMADTPEAVSTMLGSAMTALKGEVGESFLPVQKEFSLLAIDVINQIREYMPKIAQVAGSIASALSGTVADLGEKFEEAKPDIERVLDYLIENGPQVVKILGGMTGAFAAMKFAPGIETILRGAGGLVFGSKTGGSTHTGSGGIAGMMGSLFKGSQGLAGRAAGAASGALDTAKGILGTARIDAKLSGKSLLGTLFSGGKTLLGQVKPVSGASNYLGGIGSSAGNFLNKSGLAGLGKGAVGVSKEIMSGIAQATGLTDLVNAAKGKVASIGAAGIIRGHALAQGITNSAPVRAISGAAGRVVNSAPVQGLASMASGAIGWGKNTIGAGAGVLGSIWGPMASGFGGLLSGALPIVGVISGIIAVVSLLNDKFGILDGIFTKLFGEKGPEKLENFKGFMDSLFNGDGVIKAMSGLGKKLFGTFDIATESYQGGLLSGLLDTETMNMLSGAFGGVAQIAQSVMGVVGQVVTFANTTVKPIIQDIFGFITQTVVPIILQAFTAAAPMISGIISNLGTAVMTVAQVIGTAIQAVMPIVQGLITAFMSIASVVVPAVLAAWETFSGGILTIVQGVQTTFQGLLDFITGVFTGNWSLAWQGVQDIFKGVFEALGGLVKTPINAVISIVNKAISGINGLGLDIPDWVPGIGGKKFSINIPQIPMLAKGGFTNGPSIAGEAGTEAVISFQRSARANNIATWAKAGQMLGVQNQPVRLETFDGNGGGLPGNGGGMEGITYAPTIVIQGNANREDVDAALRESEARFAAWMEENFDRYYDRMERERSRKAY